ncbi:MAG TPA: VOC family protein [Fimbriimonadaceae bacterium]|jgi:PhnB protein
METIVKQQLTPMLAVHDAAAAIEFYKDAFGAEEIESARYEWEGKLGHAEVKIGDAVVMLADEFPPNNQSPRMLNGTSVILHLNMADCDAATDRAVAAGAELVRAPEDFPYGRKSKVRDPFGHVWMISGPTKG